VYTDTDVSEEFIFSILRVEEETPFVRLLITDLTGIKDQDESQEILIFNP
jgi:hypothetical protein